MVRVLTRIAYAAPFLLPATLCTACGVTEPKPVREPEEGLRELVAFSECDATGTSQIVVAAPDGTGKRQLTTGARSSWFPAFSPDGTQILYTHEMPTGLQVWVMDSDGTNRRPLATGGTNLAASWSPDARTIAYAHSPGPGERLKIWLMDHDGSNGRQLTGESDPAIDENVPRWSPDGSRIVFTSNRREGRFEIWVTEVADGSRLERLTTGRFDESLQADIEQKVPAWSPDGTKIAYWSGVEATDPRPALPRDVWVMNADGTDQRKLVGGDDPNWSPDGRTIIHSTSRDRIPALGGVSPDGSDARILFSVRACRALQSSWSRSPG